MVAKESIFSAEMDAKVHTSVGIEYILIETAKSMRKRIAEGQVAPSAEEIIGVIVTEIENLHRNGNMLEYLRQHLD